MTKTSDKGVKCVVCGDERECAHSLPLVKNGNGWESQPICSRCRASLIEEAKSNRKFIKFFPLDSSNEEAKRRNGLRTNLGSFLERYAQDYRESEIPLERKKTSRSAKG